jgi:hypothetical protein
VTAAGNLLCAYAPNYPTFVGRDSYAGVGAFVLTAGQIVLADITTPAVRGRAMAIYQGTFCSPSVSGRSRAACSPSDSVSRPRSSSMRSWAASRPVAGSASRDESGRRLDRRRRGLAAPPRRSAFVPPPRRPGRIPPVSLVSFASAFTRTGALFNVIRSSGGPSISAPTGSFALALGSVAGFGFAYPPGSW